MTLIPKLKNGNGFCILSQKKLKSMEDFGNLKSINYDKILKYLRLNFFLKYINNIFM